MKDFLIITGLLLLFGSIAFELLTNNILSW